MKKFWLSAAAAVVLSSGTIALPAQSHDPDVGGAPMYPTKNAADNISAAPSLSTLLAAAKSAGLAQTLAGPGPYTLFAPTNEAFGKLPAGTVDNLQRPENHGDLVRVLQYHLVAGKYDAKKLRKLIKKGHGTGLLKTVQGEALLIRKQGTTLVLTDSKGGQATISTADVFSSNGVLHIIDTVLMP